MDEPEDMITGIDVPIYLQYNFTAGSSPARFLTQVKRGVLSGQRCPRCANVYIPPRGSCPACGIATSAMSRSLISPWSSIIRACIAAREMVSTHSGAR